MSPSYIIRDQSLPYFLTFQVVDWVDIFSRKIYRDIMLSSFKYCREHKNLEIWGYVVMTNHVHCILRSKANALSDTIRDFKRFTATHILEAVQKEAESRRDWMLKRFEFSARSNVRSSHYQFWEHDNHPMELTSAKFINQKLNYIHLNPVRAGFVNQAHEWLYSSASNYMLLPSLMEVDLIDNF
jgi:REP element-mobilizing transposase RayT